jgi:tricorn protease-like protein
MTITLQAILTGVLLFGFADDAAKKKVEVPKAEVKKAEPAKPAEVKKPEPVKPAEVKKPEPAKPAEAKKPEPAKPAEAKKPEPAKPAMPAKPAEPKKPAGPAFIVRPAGPGQVSFMKDIAPVLVKNCVACHNPKKAESKYAITTFAQLFKGGARSDTTNLIPGKPEESDFIELIHLDGEPRMPFKQDPLPADKIALIEKWVKEGASYDGQSATEDWTLVLRRMTPITIPESYPVTVPITAVAFAPKGAELATSGYHEVNLWKIADGSIASRIRPLAERIYEISYSNDGAWLAMASGDPGQFGSVKLYKVAADGKTTLARELLETTDSVYAVAFSPDGKTLAAAGADRAIRLWNVADGKLLATIEDHADWIFDVAFSPDGKRLASASRDKTSKVFDVVKKEALVTFPGHAESVFCVAFTPDGKQVVSGGGDSQIRVWNPDDDGKQVRLMGGFGGPIFKLGYSADGKLLGCCSGDKTVRIYDNFSTKQTLKGHNDWVYTFAFSPDAKTIASGSWDGEVRLWNVADGKPVKTIIAAPGYKPPTQAAAK